MSEVNHLATVIEEHFSNPEASSFVHFVMVTDGLTAQQAANVPAPRFNSVWGVVNHVAFWQDVLCQQLQGKTVDLAAWGLTEIGGGWPPVGEVTDANWRAARQRALDINHALAATVRSFDNDQLDQPVMPGGGIPYQWILSIYAHNSHHTSEILTIRHMQGLWVDHAWT